LTADSGRFTLDFDERAIHSLPSNENPPLGPDATVGLETEPTSEEEKRMAIVSMTVNGQAVTADVDPRTLLVQFLRENLRLTGTHVGCDTSQCGACVVHLDGAAVKSCTTLAVQCQGAEVTTIEGLAQGGELHPMQAAFRENHGLQCGFCTPGMIMAAVDMVNRKGSGLDEQTIRAELEGNLCRCTGYHNIVKAVAAGAEAMAKAPIQQAAE
jgi:carbon-monoxide dehydrogenase small subunit